MRKLREPGHTPPRLKNRRPFFCLRKMSELKESVLLRPSALPQEIHNHNLVYILRSRSDKNKFYCGYTNSILKRILKHNGFLAGGARYTENYRPWEVASVIACRYQPMTKHEALSVEYWTKAKNYRGQRKKEIPVAAVPRRTWLINQAAQRLGRECSIFVFDQDILRSREKLSSSSN